tara:strand:- start:4050 stop:5162 length:1113 start_codon:yes stop_codon:yes gene_type:complete
MALNFPANTSLPYVDPISGLKYIYNTSVGAWEAAIQPPAIVSSVPPEQITIPGFLWWDDVGGSLYIWYQDTDGGQWVDASPSGENVASAYVQINAPTGALPGELWWDSANGRLYIYYDDGDSQQWMQATTGSEGGTGTVNYGLKLYSGAATPTNAKRNDLWYNSTESTLYAFVGDIPEWKKSHNIIDPSTFVTAVTGVSPISVGGTAKEPAISVATSSTTVTGVVRLATVTEAGEGLDKTVALSPGVLKEALVTAAASYLPSSSASVAGVVTLATQAEVVTGAINNKSITPLALKQAIPSLGLSVPVGTIITYGGSIAPSGYLVCDGSLLSRTTYKALFQVIGTAYGIGDGSTTFKLPTVTATFTSCIKF